MSDEETIATDGVGLDGATGEEAAATTEETGATETQETAGETAPEENKAELEAQAALDAEGKDGEETETVDYKPNLKFKVMDKEHEIPKEFEALMKDEKSEKMVRELHEKAFGLDVVKQKFNETRDERNHAVTELTGLKAGIDGLRSIVQGAMKSGNLLKLDDFFQKLNIPPQTIMQYALAKVNFDSLPPEQKQMLEANMSAEKRAEMLEQQFQQTQETVATQAQQIKGQQLDFTLAREDFKPIADAWDQKIGKPGSFRDLVAQVGHLAWLQSNGKTDLTPEQAVQQVISGYGLKAPDAAAANTTVTPTTQTAPSGKKVIQRATNVIPNVQGRSSSPLKAKPKSIDDLKKLYNEHVNSETA